MSNSHNPVLLHVYDLEEVPGAIAAIGLGAYHRCPLPLDAHPNTALMNGWCSAVEIGGKEYAYGACEVGSGVWCGVPKRAEGFKFKKSVAMGYTRLSEADIVLALEDLKARWQGVDYDLLTRNCNHFSSATTKVLVRGGSGGGGN